MRERSLGSHCMYDVWRDSASVPKRNHKECVHAPMGPTQQLARGEAVQYCSNDGVRWSAGARVSAIRMRLALARTPQLLGTN